MPNPMPPPPIPSGPRILPRAIPKCSNPQCINPLNGRMKVFNSKLCSKCAVTCNSVQLGGQPCSEKTHVVFQGKPMCQRHAEETGRIIVGNSEGPCPYTDAWHQVERKREEVRVESGIGRKIPGRLLLQTPGVLQNACGLCKDEFMKQNNRCANVCGRQAITYDDNEQPHCGFGDCQRGECVVCGRIRLGLYRKEERAPYSRYFMCGECKKDEDEELEDISE